MSYRALQEEINPSSTVDDLSQQNILDESGEIPPDAVSPGTVLPESRVLNPMSAWAGSATIINLVLATGPFSYPYPFVQCGFIISVTLMIVTLVIAYMTATFMIEAISVS